MFLRAIVSLVVIILTTSAVYSQPRLEFRRMVAHWTDYAHPDYLPFIEDARPEIVQVGFYGGHFWSLAHTPQYKGYPAHFPVQGLNEGIGAEACEAEGVDIIADLSMPNGSLIRFVLMDDHVDVYMNRKVADPVAP